MSILILICSFVLIQSTLVLFSILFGSLQSYSVNFVPFGPIQYILIHFDLFLCTYIIRKYMFGLKALILNPNLLIAIWENIFL